jgi:hypothetical protein
MKVYNLEVAEWENCAVGYAGILGHNSGVLDCGLRRLIHPLGSVLGCRTRSVCGFLLGI